MKNKLKGSLNQKYIPKIPSREELQRLDNNDMWRSVFQNSTSLDEFNLIKRILSIADRDLSSKNANTVADLISDALSQGIIERDVVYVIPTYSLRI